MGASDAQRNANGPEGARRAGFSLRRFSTAKAAVLGAGGLASAVAGVLGLVFLVWPALKPESPPAAASGRIVPEELEIVDRGLPLGDYCRRRGLPCPGLSPAQLGARGHVVSFAVEAEGYEDKRLPLRWSMYAAATGQRVADPAFNDQAAWPDDTYVPARRQDRNTGEFWVPLPGDPGTYYVRLELYPHEGARLDAQDTGPFEVR